MTADVMTSNASAVANSRSRVEQSLKRRYAAEARFKAYGIAAIAIGLAFLVIVFASIIQRGYTSFVQSEFRLDVTLDKDVIDPSGTGDESELLVADYPLLIQNSLVKALKLDPNSQTDNRLAGQLLSANADVTVRDYVLAHRDS
ncbi:MAG: DUF3333 domain-containing protein, partial [Hyphomicrobiaceae bacterium]